MYCLRKDVLSLHCIGSNTFLQLNDVKIYQFKSKDLEVKPYLSCLEDISKDFMIDNMKKTVLNEYVSDFPVNYNSDVSRYP